jgi:hypothetical protein
MRIAYKILENVVGRDNLEVIDIGVRRIFKSWQCRVSVGWMHGAHDKDE